MRFRTFVLLVICAALSAAVLPAPAVRAQGGQSGATAAQRIDVMLSRLETMRRTLNSALAGLNAKESNVKELSADDPRARLSGLEKEAGSLLSEVHDVRGKQERAERYDQSILERLETSVAELDTRVQNAMRETAGDRRAGTSAAASDKKKKGGLFSRLLGRGGSDKYDELVGTVAAGRDRQLFEEATKEARKKNFETARSLYAVIISTYPDSPYLPLSKLAIADTFYLEGTTSALIQAASYYQDWLTFFPTDPLADDVMLKIAEAEMRQMGLPDRQTTNARKAEHRLKVLLQQFPNTSLRPEAEVRLREVQENLAMHSYKIGNFYFDRYYRGVATNLTGAKSRYREIVEKYPHFSLNDRVLYRLGIINVQEEEPDEAAKYFQQLLREFPNSEFAEKAGEQLDAIGTPRPQATEEARRREIASEGSFLSNLMTEIKGSAQVTVNKDGVIIGRDDKAQDLIQRAIENNGTIPDSYHVTPVSRVAPARTVMTSSPAPAKNPQAPPTNSTPDSAAPAGSGEGRP